MACTTCGSHKLKENQALIYTTQSSANAKKELLCAATGTVTYFKANLPYTGVQTGDDLTTIIQKIDVKLSPASIFALFISAIDNDPALKAILCDRIGTC
jgi:hypothetical protein